MKRTFMVALTSALLATMALAGSASAASDTRQLQFESRYDVFKFKVQVDDGTKLRVDTKDCCIEGDFWGVLLVRPHDGKQSPPRRDSACGNGSTEDFSGLATMPAASGKVIAYVYICTPFVSQGAFPAGMDVRFRYNGTMTVTQKGGA
ncbi:MAG: hypothetical protein M3472_02005 [Chloroflexota bacterium]|nr:hypothetical protein [Chloroflexota bacterium]